MNKAEKEYCNNCTLYNHCGFVSRSMEGGCSEMAAFSLGFEKAIEEVCRFLENNLRFYWSQKIPDPSDFIVELKEEIQEEE